MSDHELWKDRYAVSENPSTPALILVKLSDDEKAVVRIAVARNPSTSMQTLIKLSNDEILAVRNNANVAIKARTSDKS
jgi:hypothetical protein